MPLNNCDYIPFNDDLLMQTEHEFCYGIEMFDDMTGNIGLTNFKLADIVGPDRITENTKVLAILFTHSACDPCYDKIPFIDEMVEEIHYEYDQDEFVFIEHYLEASSANYTCEQWGDGGYIGVPPMTIGTDVWDDDHLYWTLDSPGQGFIPKLVLIDKAGKFIGEWSGEDIEEEPWNLIKNIIETDTSPCTGGCTDPSACNYDIQALWDDGSCFYGYHCSDGSYQCYYHFCGDCLNTEVGLWGECYNIQTTTILNLDNIALSGEIPSVIGNLTNLTWLNLMNNQLTGEIPPEIGNLTNLTYLSLPSNQLTGEIPSEIGNLTNLTYLNLAYNELSGYVPPEICNYSDTLYMILWDNNLCPVYWGGNTYPACIDESTWGTQNTSNCPELGDINMDGGHNILDLALLVGYIIGDYPLTPPQIALADMNQSGSISINDVVMLINSILNDDRTSQNDRREAQKQLDRLDSVLSSSERKQLQRQLNRTSINYTRQQSKVNGGSSHLYVKYKTRLTTSQLNQEKSKFGLTSITHATKRTDLIPSAANVVIVEGGDINQIKQDPNVVLVEEAPHITYHDDINDPFYNNNFIRDQLYLENIGHRDAIEEFGFGSHSPLLGMMDGAVLSENLPFTDKPPHPDLEGKVTYYQDTNDITVLSQNNIGHGTAVASIITTNTNNEWGMGGTCPNCSLVYFDSMYSGDGLFPLLEGGVELGVRAANISMGGTQEYWDPGSQIIQDAINDAYNQGLILVVSAGNDGIDIADEFYTYCSYDNTLCVTTSNQYNTDSSGNFIDVSAPLGECAACPYTNCSSGMDEFGNSANPAWFRSFNGTSSSTPVVTGLVGLLLSHNPNLTNQDIYDIVTSTNINYSYGDRPGTIDFYEALSYMYENYMGDVEPLIGDINQDGIVNILDVVVFVDRFVEAAGDGEQLMSQYPEMDINGDGIVNILDVVLIVNIIFGDERTTSEDRQEVQKQLDRLNSVLSSKETEELHRQLGRLDSFLSLNEFNMDINRTRDCDPYEEVQLWYWCYNIDDTDSIYWVDASNWLEGLSIPREIGQLINLHDVQLVNNQLAGDIPYEIGELPLYRLDLRNNRITGEIPPEIGNLTDLKYLHLESNQLTGEIPSEIGNLTDLEELFLTDNQFSGEIPPEIGNLTNLDRLDLVDNQLTGEIPPEIGNLINLTTLNLSNNQLSGEIPQEICNQGDSTPLLWNNQLCPPYPYCISQDEIDSQDTSNCYELGDINMDTDHNIQDIVLLVNYILGQGTLTDEQIALTDMNNDGIVNIQDVIALINIIISDTRTTSEDRQKAQKQLNRLNSFLSLNERKQKANVMNRNEFNMDLGFNPVLDKNLYSGDGSLLTADGDPYIPGNYLWNEYNGQYHTHYNGEICAGPHDREMVIDPERRLSVSAVVLKYDSKIIDNRQFELSKKLMEQISELPLSRTEKMKLQNTLLSYKDLSDIKLEKPIVENKRKKKNLNIRLNRTIGCTNPFARNFDIYAETDDGSCEYIWNIFPQTFKMTGGGFFSYITLHSNGRFTTNGGNGTPRICDGQYQIDGNTGGEFDNLHTGYHTIRLEYNAHSDEECSGAGQDPGCQTIIEGDWDGDVYNGFTMNGTKWDGSPAGMRSINNGWFHAPLIGSLGFYSTDGINSNKILLYEDGQYGDEWLTDLRINTQDNFRKSKYNKTFFNLLGNPEGSGGIGGEYEIDLYNQKIKWVYHRQDNSRCIEAGLPINCRSVGVADLYFADPEFRMNPTHNWINGGYYNEDGGYYVPVWARGFIMAEGAQGQINANAYCEGENLGSGRIRAVRYTPAKNGHRYESSWNYIDGDWVESNYTSPSQGGMYAAFAICCGDCDWGVPDEEYINTPLNENTTRMHARNSVVKKVGDVGEGYIFSYKEDNGNDAYINFNNADAGPGDFKNALGIEASYSLPNPQIQNCGPWYSDEYEWSTCECMTTGDYACPGGYKYDFESMACIIDCPDGTEWNGSYYCPDESCCLSYIQGDANGDGTVNVLDVVAMIQMILNDTDIDGDLLARVDMNNDGGLNILDVIIVVNLILSGGGLSTMEMDSLKSLLKNIREYPNDLDTALKKSFDLFSKTIFGTWMCPDKSKTITDDCIQMSAYEQLLWDEYNKGRRVTGINLESSGDVVMTNANIGLINRTRNFGECELLPFDDSSFVWNYYDFCYGWDAFNDMTGNIGLERFRIADIIGPESVTENTEALVILFNSPLCGPCVDKIGDIDQKISYLYDNYGRDKFVFINHFLDPNDGALSCTDWGEEGITRIPPMTIGGSVSNDILYEELHIFGGGVPYMLILDKNGKFINAFIGNDVIDDEPWIIIEDMIQGIDPCNSGCTDQSACNYIESATTDDGSCFYGWQCRDGSYQCYYDDCDDCRYGHDDRTSEIGLWGECYGVATTTSLDISLLPPGLRIPPEIGQLSNLRYLTLQNNGFVGEIPFELGNLTNLEAIVITNNQLTGGIPSNIWSLSNLRILALPDNNLTGQIPINAGTGMPNLMLVNLEFNNFTGNIPNSLCVNDLAGAFTHNRFCPPYPGCFNTNEIGYQDTKGCLKRKPIPEVD